MSDGDGSPEDDDAGNGTNRPPWAAVGSALGGIARRVGELVSDVSETVTVAERTREALARAEVLRDGGRELDALEIILDARKERPDDALLIAGAKLTWCWAQIFGEPDQRFALDRLALDRGAPASDDDGSAPSRARDQLLETVDDLAAAVLEIRGDRPDAALDAIRRATRGKEPWLRSERVSHRVVLHTVAAKTLDALGLRDRAIREVQRARAAAGTQPGPGVRAELIRLGTALLLADGRAGQAERWLEDLQSAPGNDDDELNPRSPELQAFRARIYAARGDAFRAEAALEGLEGEPHLESKARVALVIGDVDAATRHALGLLQRQPDDPRRQRLWALAQFSSWRRPADDRPTPWPGRDDVLGALVRAAEGLPAQRRREHLQELAQVVLYADAFDHPAAMIAAGAKEETEEVHLLKLRLGLSRGEDVSEAFVAGPPPRLRRGRDLGGPYGPDEISPLRDADFSARTSGAQRQLALAEWSLSRGRRDDAGHALVQALVEDPDSRQAADMLASLSPARPEPRLEACLADATELLASVPAQILGVSLEGVGEALSRVVAARERLARPLTIAIMGEFSSGKSSFVNALLGENVAPTGVLPTTSTINVFRRGPSGGARVHYRDGHIETLGREQVEPFLHGLDDVAASRIRYMEIERTGDNEVMGDAAVVDTPGLNALDEFHERVAREFLEEADAVVWIFSATKSGAASEGTMLESLREGGRRVLGVLNKVDTLEPGEQKELADYLRQQLGEVLAEVVPLSATQAIAWRQAVRSGESPPREDPFAPVDRALETHFLADARSLKRTLTRRRLDEALDTAKSSVDAAISTLEAQARDPELEEVELAANRFLEHFQAELERELLALDDVLAREWLAVGIVEVKRGLVRGSLDALDRDYLEAHFDEVVIGALDRALQKLAASSDEASEAARALGERFGPWARGHIAGLRARGYVAALVRDRAPAAAHGESELRAAVRSGMSRFSMQWRLALDELRRPLGRDLALVRRRVHAMPRAEALRLRAATVAGIDALRGRLEDVE